MSDFKAKMHQIRSPLELCSAGALPQTPLAELTALPRSIVVLKGPTFKGREEKGMGGGKAGKER